MKIKSIRISNILCFRYYENISEAQEIVFNDDLNILIGENGSGKSTCLEVINFVLKKILFRKINFNHEIYSKSTATDNEKRAILTIENNNQYNEFRLDPNWKNENEIQKIKIEINLDDIDKNNFNILLSNKEKIIKLIQEFSNASVYDNITYKEKYIIDIEFRKNLLELKISPDSNDLGYIYLERYFLFKKIIDIYNEKNPNDCILNFYDTFSLICCYRNYNEFSSSISLNTKNSAFQTLENLSKSLYSQSTNTSEKKEPAIFSLVRLHMAEHVQKLLTTPLSLEECIEKSNNLNFVQNINNKLKIINLKIEIELSDLLSWNFSFSFSDVANGRKLGNINHLSAGQKAIIHLIFEAYGRGELKGGIVIIDEPEIHLHYQFQNYYLRTIEEINKEQKCQYILVTHSESLINSKTIHKVMRFSLDEERNAIVSSSRVQKKAKVLVKILDNVRATYAFFAKKVLLVEGEDDRYFFKALIQHFYSLYNQEIAVLNIDGKANLDDWKSFFCDFGLSIYFIGDLDNANNIIYEIENPPKLKTTQAINEFKKNHSDLDSRIEEKYNDNIFILKNGALENYLEIHNKGLDEIIKFCDNNLDTFFNNGCTSSKEMKFILEKILEIQ